MGTHIALGFKKKGIQKSRHGVYFKKLWRSNHRKREGRAVLHACDGKINALEVWMGKPEGNGPLGRQSDNINMGLGESWGGKV
jgi:hypothetical protein